MSNLVPPHGGRLVHRLVAPGEVAEVEARAARAPRIILDGRELADLELIAVGAASPLTGFLGSRDYFSVLERSRLADGTVWPLPFTLAVDESVAATLTPGADAALFDGRGRLWGLIRVSEIHRRDPLAEAAAVYRTEDEAHPGVAYLLARPVHLVAGEVTVLPLATDLPFFEHRLTPAELRAEIARRGWIRIAGFQTRNPIHRAHEHLTKLALEAADGLVIHPLVGETKNDDVPAAVRFRTYEALIRAYYPKDRILLAAFPAAMRYAGPREALFHALVRKNYGITHLVVGRDHAGVGKYYGPLEAQEIFDRFGPAEIGVSPLRFDPTFFCTSCGNLASLRTCPHDASARLELSGTKVREILRTGGTLPTEFTRPEVAEILRSHYRAAEGAAAGPTQPGPGPGAPTGDSPAAGIASTAAATPAPAAPVPGRGYVLWFTGLSGAGKSTLSQALRQVLAGDRPVEILDGDEVRTYLSKGLGFSKEDRDTNIRRIGYVARVLARNGVAAITAAISPYADVRAEVRALAARDGIPFIEVFASAGLEALVARDVKGLYRKALAGEIAHFTGVSDPYEPPAAPEVTVYTDRETVEESLARILAALDRLGLRESSPPASVSSPAPAADPVPRADARLFPTFLKLAGRRVVLVGGGAVAATKLPALLEAGARVTVVAPSVQRALERPGVVVLRREFAAVDLDGAWFAVAAAVPEVNRQVRAAAEARGIFVNAVDDPDVATAYAGSILRRDGLTVAVSTEGLAPALAGLVREGIDSLVPQEDFQAWLERARALRDGWRADGIPLDERRPLLLQAINRLYDRRGIPSGAGRQA